MRTATSESRRLPHTCSGYKHLGPRPFPCRSTAHSSVRQPASLERRPWMSYPIIPQIGIIMSSEKDLPQMEVAAYTLRDLGIPFEMTALSPYRLPERVRDYGLGAEERGYE